MKTERRHELQTNTLAQSLGEGIVKARPYTNQILLAIGAIIVLFLAVGLFRSQARAKRASAWEAYFLATTDSETSAETEQERLRTVLKDFSDTEMADWARLTLGDEGLNRGAELITSDKSEAQKNLNAAMEEYRPLADSSSVPQVRDLANYNMGLCYELQGQLDKAEDSYRRVKGTMAKLATERADKLKNDEEVQEFYDWFAKAEPPRRPVPGGSMPGRMPPFEAEDPKVVPFDDVPGGGDLPPVQLFPEKTEGSNPDANPGDVKLPSLDTPEVPATPATGDPPATEPAPTDAPAIPEAKPADESASTPEKPAAEAKEPAAEKPAAADATDAPAE